jgi:hypothetical protein
LAPPPREGGRPPPPPIGLEEQGKGRSSARHRRIRPPDAMALLVTVAGGERTRGRAPLASPGRAPHYLASPSPARRGGGAPPSAIAVGREPTTSTCRCWRRSRVAMDPWWRPSRPPLCVTAGARGGGARCALLRDNAPAQEGRRGRPPVPGRRRRRHRRRAGGGRRRGRRRGGGARGARRRLALPAALPTPPPHSSAAAATATVGERDEGGEGIA